MRRLLLSAAASLACALATSGCADLNPFDSSAPPPAPAKQAQAAPAGIQQASPLPTDVDNEIARAQAFRAKGQFDDAIHVLSQLMLVAPDNPGVVGEYGKTLTQQGRASDAVDFLSRAIELTPDDWTLYSALGVDYDQLDRHDEAENAYKHALTLKPDNPAVLNNYAMSQLMAGHLDHAETLLKQAQTHGGDAPKIKNNLAMIAQMRAKQGAPVAAPNSGAAGLANNAPAFKLVPAGKPAPKVASAKLSPVKPTPALATTATAQAIGPVMPLKLAARVKDVAGAPHRLQPAVQFHPVKAAEAQKPAKPAVPRVVMEKVPFDPLAGKVYPAPKSAPHEAVAAKASHDKPKIETAKKKPAAKPGLRKQLAKELAPALRTASDLY